MSEVKIKGGLEGIRLRPGMYIGSTYDPTQLLLEVFDNSRDEISANYADVIEITIDKNTAIITDNGRGIKVEEVVDEETDQKFNSIVAIATKLHSGGKFDNDIYENSGGLHGIGLTAVNALSHYLTITVKDRKDRNLFHNYEFTDGVLSNQESKVIKDQISWSTRVEFQANPKYFSTPNFNLETLKHRLKLAKSRIPKARFILNDQELESLTFEDFIRETLDLPDESKLLKVSTITPTYQIYGYISYDLTTSSNPTIFGDVNLCICSGVYQQNFLSSYLSAIKNSGKFECDRNDILSYLRVYVCVLDRKPEFDSQVKLNMTKDLSTTINTIDFNSIIFDPFIRESLEDIIEKKSLKRAAKKINNRTRKTSEGNPLADCIKIPGDVLYIMEGRSAKGTLDRNKYTEGVLPISGKILNTAKAKAEKATSSTKFKYLLEALGVQLGKNWTPRYKLIKILTDADPDGMHIADLVLVGIWKYAPKLIIDKKVSLLLPPLYGAIKKNHPFIPIYDSSLIDGYRNQGFDVRRFKGLGEMTPSQLEVIVRVQPREYIVEAPKSKKEENAILMVLSKEGTQLKRELCEDTEHFKLERLFEAIVTEERRP